MKELKIKIVDFWGGFNYTDNFITDILRKHYKLVFSETPDFVFCSVFGMDCLNYNAVRICFTGENIRIDFNIYDYGIGFDWFDVDDRYLRFPLYALYKSDLEKALCKHNNLTITHLNQHNKFCNFVYSNSQYVMPQREELLNILNEYKTVDCGGRYKNNVGGPVADKLAFLSDYKFTIAVENTATPGYTTEKIIQAWAAGTVPIYYGNSMIDKEFNSGSFVNCHEYKTFRDILAYVKYLDNNDDAYMSIMKTPIFAEDTYVQKYSVEDVLAPFILKIVGQDKENAYRRDLYGWGKVYEQRRKREFIMGNSMLGKLFGKICQI